MWDWLDGIGSFFDSAAGLLDAVYQALVWLYNLLVAVVNWLVGVLNAVFSFFLNVLKGIWNVLQHIWNGFFKPILTRLANVIIRAHQWLEEHLGPVLKFLYKVRAWLDRFFLTYIRPFLNLIQHIRRVLLVLRLLHIKWAAALDRRLGQLEADVARVFLTIRGRLTDLISVVNAITQPVGIARVIAGTIGGRRVFAALTRIWTGLPLGHFFPNNAAGAAPWERRPQNAADYRDPIKNPPASVILSGLSVGDFFQPSELDPIPTLDQVDAAADSYIGGQVIDQFLATEAALAAPPVGEYDPVSSVNERRGLFAGSAAALSDAAWADAQYFLA